MKKTDIETYHASDNMKKFFQKLTELKEYVGTKICTEHSSVLVEIYEKLDEIFKVEVK